MYGLTRCRLLYEMRSGSSPIPGLQLNALADILTPESDSDDGCRVSKQYLWLYNNFWARPNRKVSRKALLTRHSPFANLYKRSQKQFPKMLARRATLSAYNLFSRMSLLRDLQLDKCRSLTCVPVQWPSSIAFLRECNIAFRVQHCAFFSRRPELDGLTF